MKSQIIQQLEKDKYKYTDREYKALLAKAMELANKIRSRFGYGGDVFFKAGVFMPQSTSSYPLALETNAPLLLDAS